MKLIIQNDNGENIYERTAGLHEFNDLLRCEDCKHYIQHYVISDVPNTNNLVVWNGKEGAFLCELYEGHCTGCRSCKKVKKNGVICNHFVLKAKK